MSVVRRVLPDSLGPDYEQERRRLEGELVALLADSTSTIVVSPVQAMAIVYGLRVPAHTRRRLHTMLRDESALLGGAGRVYVLRDARDPPNRLKIGVTVRRVAQRLSEHRHDLCSRTDVVIVASVACAHAELLESCVHLLLECAHLPHLVNTHTQRAATEYYEISNLRRLELLLRTLARYITTHVRR